MKQRKRKKGMAALALSRFRERREHMRLKFSKETAWLLNNMIRQPESLPLKRVGMTEYRSKDRGGSLHLEKIKLHWLEKKVLRPLGEMNEDPKWRKKGFEFVDYDGSLQKVHADRLNEVVTH